MKPEERRSTAKVPHPDEHSVLLIGDVQVDFCPGGALPVPCGDQIIPTINATVRLFHSHTYPIIAIRDWHPVSHCSFTDQGGRWPTHCVQGSKGAQFHPDLLVLPATTVVSKATEPEREAYSGFDGTSLEERLRDLRIERLYVTGLATDYCVRQTVLDALRLGFQVVVLEDAIKGIDAAPGDSSRAIADMRTAGAIVAQSSAIGI